MSCGHKYTNCNCPDPLGWRILEWCVAHVAPFVLLAAVGTLILYAALLVVSLIRAAL